MVYVRQHFNAAGMRRGRRQYRGRGFIGRMLNRAIDKLPFELHIPGGYQFCGPGTKLTKRLQRGDRGINPLDEACREHDIAYHNYKGGEERKRADEALAKAAWERVTSRDASVGERAAALGVAGVMKVKSKIGGRVKTVKRLHENVRRRRRRRNVDSETSQKNNKRSNIDLKTLNALAKTKRSLRGKTPRPPSSSAPAPLRPMTSEERLKTEVEKARENIRNKMSILQDAETMRNRLLDTYLTTPVSKALHRRQGEGKTNTPPSSTSIKHEPRVEAKEEAAAGSSFETLPELEDEEEDRDVRSQHYEQLQRYLSNAAIGLGDTTLGPYYIGGRPHIGHAFLELHPEDGTFSVQGHTFYPEPGLLELLFESHPNLDDVTEGDLKKYKKILELTSAHRRDFKSNLPLNTRGNPWKYRHIISHLFAGGERQSKRLAERKKKKKKGSGLRFVTAPDYKYWRDPNTLVERLRLLHASKAAGNNGLDGEIVEIEDELRDAGIIV